MSFPEDPHQNTPLEGPLIKTAQEGGLIRAGLEELFAATGFDSRLVIQYGAACFDVEYAPEAVALRPFKPARLYLAEYLGSDDDSEIKREVIKINSAGMNTQIFGNNFARAIQEIKKRIGGQRLGLATLISMWPDDAHEETIARYLQDASTLLQRGGLVLLTLREDQLYDRLNRVARRNIPGLDLGARKIEVLDEYSVYGFKR